MEITMQEKDVHTFLELVLAGNLMLNGNRVQNEVLEDYDELCYRLLGESLKQKGIPCGEDFDRKIADLRDRLYDRIQQYVLEYERQSVPYTLAEQLAARDFPAEADEEQRIYAAERYEQILLQNGISCIRLDAPAVVG